MDNGLRDASVRGRHASVKTPESIHVVHTPHTLQRVHSPLPTVPASSTFPSWPLKRRITRPLTGGGSSPGFQLQTSLDQPDGIGGCDGCEPWQTQERAGSDRCTHIWEHHSLTHSYSQSVGLLPQPKSTSPERITSFYTTVSQQFHLRKKVQTQEYNNHNYLQNSVDPLHVKCYSKNTFCK